MDDAQILQQIEKLVEEERELREQAKGEMTDEAHARLESLEIGLDQCWDLLRQRRALRESSARTRNALTPATPGPWNNTSSSSERASAMQVLYTAEATSWGGREVGFRTAS